MRNFAAPYAALIAAAFLLAACTGGDGSGGDETAAAGPPPMPQPITMASRPEATGGEAKYIEYCIMCHGPNGMGTGLLGRRMEVSLLEARDNLTADYVISAARLGIGNMPSIPRGEVSDEDLQEIADYLAAGPHIEPTPAGGPQ